jgi:hypothetical protein
MFLIVIIVFFVPMACPVLRMTSIGDCANTFEDGTEYRSQDSLHVAIPSKWLPSDSYRIRSPSVDALPGVIFGLETEMDNQRRENLAITSVSAEFPESSTCSPGSAAQVLRH